MLTIAPQETSKSSMYYALQFLKENLTDVVIQVGWSIGTVIRKSSWTPSCFDLMNHQVCVQSSTGGNLSVCVLEQATLLQLLLAISEQADAFDLRIELAVVRT